MGEANNNLCSVIQLDLSGTISSQTFRLFKIDQFTPVPPFSSILPINEIGQHGHRDEIYLNNIIS